MSPFLLFALHAALMPSALMPSALMPSALMPPARPQPTVTPYRILAAENQREAGVPVLLEGLASSDTVVQRLAARALGRLRKAEYAPRLEPLATSPAVTVRVAAVRASMALGASLWQRVQTDRDAAVRAAMFEAMGHAAPDTAVEARLARALTDEPLTAQRGAARGLEYLIRANARTWKPSASTVEALRRAVARTTDGDVRLVSLLALTGARDRDSATVALSLRDADPEVRRAAVAMGRVWVDDAHPMVRWQALSVAPTCERAAALTRDTSEHVALLAIDQLGARRCDRALLQPFLAAGTAWRPRAHATMALARVDSAAALPAIRALARDPVRQARAWAAQAAQAVKDSATLHRLARDPAPTVASEALTTTAEAVAALTRDHAGLLRTAALLLQKAPATARTDADDRAVRAAFTRISTPSRFRWRDARVELIKALDRPTPANLAWLAPRVRDDDPEIAAAAELLLGRAGQSAPTPAARRLPPPPMPSEAALAALEGATATIAFRGKGTVVMRLDVTDAPIAAYTFATLARAGRYAGNTIHRIVPNFVIQGGSPGANEYDPVTAHFMRDEVGGENRRGTFGISTRGYDTGDGQIYVNLIYNLRLDGDYTVFGTVQRGLDVIDRIQEGDVITSVTITPRPRTSR